jgi:two-component system, NtrC family, response regulator AtoC
VDRILIVDDDQNVRYTLSNFLETNGFSSIEASDGSSAVEIFEKERPLLVLLDLKMPVMDGMECLKLFRRMDTTVPVIMVTAHGDVPTAVKAIQRGAYDFILKPPDFDRLMLTITRAVEKAKLEETLRTSLETMFGKSPAMKAIVEQVRQVAPSDFSIILQGETGTGKSFIARAIHNFSTRADGPFISVDIGAMPENLVESELFGYEKGAFTSAEKKKKGFFEISHNGTILLDELQNMSLYVQSKLLKVVEERRIYPLGSTTPVEIDSRIIAASNADIMEAVRNKKIREDLFFRLGEFIINIPPLRERPEDIPFFIQGFFREAMEGLNKQIREISGEAMESLRGYPWPGNVRELKNAIRRAVLLCQGDTIRPEHLSLGGGFNDKHGESGSMLLLQEVTLDAEKKAIRQALELTKGNRTKAALVLEISHRSLLRKMKEYNIK